MQWPRGKVESCISIVCIHECVLVYAADSGVLTVSKDDFEKPDDIFDALGEMLAEVAPVGTTENTIRYESA